MNGKASPTLLLSLSLSQYSGYHFMSRFFILDHSLHVSQACAVAAAKSKLFIYDGRLAQSKLMQRGCLSRSLVVVRAMRHQ
jgi:hypothetical protein